MSFVALVVNLKSMSTDRSIEQESVTDAAAYMSPYEMFAAVDIDLLSTLQYSLERGHLTLSMIKHGRGALSLRVTAMAEEGHSSMSELLQAIALHPVLNWRQRQWAVEATDLTHSRWAGTSAWADFLAEPAGRTLNFHLGTPLVVSSPAAASEGRTSHFPHPRLVFAELARRWRDLGGPTLPADLLSRCEQGGCVVADYRLYGSTIALPEGGRQGFLGWIVYQCRSGSPDFVAALTALARFAFFAGLGHFTTCGMGATRVTIGS